MEAQQISKVHLYSSEDSYPPSYEDTEGIPSEDMASEDTSTQIPMVLLNLPDKSVPDFDMMTILSSIIAIIIVIVFIVLMLYFWMSHNALPIN